MRSKNSFLNKTPSLKKMAQMRPERAAIRVCQNKMKTDFPQHQVQEQDHLRK